MRVYPDETQDYEFQTLGDLGHTGNLNDRQFQFLRGKGFTGSLTDMFMAFLSDQLASYAANGFTPPYVLDFVNETYGVDGLLVDSYSDAVTATVPSLGTMTDSDGTIKWAAHNYSTNLSLWSTFSDGSLTGGQADNEGGTSAYLVDSISGTGTGFIIVDGGQISIASDGATVDYEVVAKKGDSDFIYLYAGNISNAPGVSYFDLNTGTIGSTGPNVTSHTISSLGGEWYLCRIAFQIGADNVGDLRIGVCNVNNGANSADKTNASAYVYQPRVYRSDLGGMVNNPDRDDSYVPTEGSAVYLPRIGNHVYNGVEWENKGLLLESEERTNILAYSQDFTNADWTKGPNTATLALDSVGPDGLGNSAVKLIDNDAGGTGAVQINRAKTITTSTAQTFSVYAKKDQMSWLTLFALGFSTPANGGVTFDLENGVVGTEETGLSGSIQHAGNGWYRCSVSFTSDAADSAGTMIIYVTREDGGTIVDLDGTSSILIYGAQWEQASTPSSYIPTSGSTVTRAAETLVASSANLPWPEPVVIGPELVTNGTFDTDLTGWITIGDGSAAVVSAEASITGGVSGNTGIRQEIVVPNGLYQVSVGSYGGSSPRLAIYDGTALGILRSNQIGTISTVDVLITTGKITVFPYTTAGQTATFDNISVKEINPLAVSIAIEGTMTYADEDTGGDTNGGGGEVNFILWKADASNFTEQYMYTSSANVGSVAFAQKEKGVRDAVVDVDTYSPGVNVPFNIASRHGSTFINGAVNGVALTEDSTPTALADLSASNLSIGDTFMGNISEVLVWADDIEDAGLEEATS